MSIGFRSFILSLILALFGLGMLVFNAHAFPKKYDDDIHSSVINYWPHFPDWLSWKAQLWQESRLDPNAVSPVGARGIAQFMPGTWNDIVIAMHYPIISRPDNAKLAIQAGAFYMARLRKAWLFKRTELERHKLAAASYNAGLGNIIKAQVACDDARNWVDIAPCLKLITGFHSKETLTYIKLIWRWRAKMELDL